MAVISAKDQLIALFNSSNPGLTPPLTAADVALSAVSAYTPGDGGDTRNSKVTMTGEIASQYYTGEKELHFTRLTGNGLLGDKSLTEDQADWDTDEEVLARFNADMLTLNGVDAFTLEELTINRTDGQDTDKIIVVHINAGHLKFLEGDAATYFIKQPIVKTDLSTTDGELNGFA